MAALELRMATVGPWPMNAYAYVCEETGASVLIDPGADPETLLELLEESTPKAIILTHTHPDHIGALAEMQTRLGVPVWGYGGELAERCGISIARELRAGDTIELGAQKLHIYEAPGHIDDQICLYPVDDHRVVVGDAIFPGGPGKTWSAAGFRTTLQTLRNVILPWPDDTECYPGHGEPFRLGDIRTQIEAFLNRAHRLDFFGDASWEE